jgi:hypothetical protein
MPVSPFSLPAALHHACQTGVTCASGFLWRAAEIASGRAPDASMIARAGYSFGLTCCSAKAFFIPSAAMPVTFEQNLNSAEAGRLQKTR